MPRASNSYALVKCGRCKFLPRDHGVERNRGSLVSHPYVPGGVPGKADDTLTTLVWTGK